MIDTRNGLPLTRNGEGEEIVYSRWETRWLHSNIYKVAFIGKYKASAGMFADKMAEIKKFYPIIASEIVVEQISKDKVYIEFKSGAKITNLENKQTAKGKRRNLVITSHLI